ncbi:MAG TPA: ATP-binding cassette domain-containing protein [bacterium]|nr:ATP-binding cassette domain-containing protein [bacterium]
MRLDAPAAGRANALGVRDVVVRYGALTALEGVTVTFPPGGICGVIGPNGAGKTTLLNAVSGFTEITSGAIVLGDTDITALDIRRRVGLGVVRGFQTPRVLDQETVRTNVAVGCEPLGHPSILSQLLNLPAQRRAEARDARLVDGILDVLGLAGFAERKVDELPFAIRRLVEVGRVLVAQPKVMLLDEPAAGVDEPGRNALAEVIRRIHGEMAMTVVVVEHNVDFVGRLCQYAVALDSGRVISNGPVGEVLADDTVRVAYFGVERHVAS